MRTKRPAEMRLVSLLLQLFETCLPIRLASSVCTPVDGVDYARMRARATRACALAVTREHGQANR